MGEVGESPNRCLMRLVMECMEDLHQRNELTPTQLSHVQTLVRAYRYKYEVDFGLQPQRFKAFCRSLFDVPTSITASVARGAQRRGFGAGGKGRIGGPDSGFKARRARPPPPGA